MQPEPVPTSRMRRESAGDGRSLHADPLQYCLDHMLGLRTGNEHRWRNDEVHAQNS